MAWRKASLSTIQGGELSLSAHAVTSLLEGVFSKGASFRFRAKGYSMHPWIRHGDVITLSANGPKSPDIGDVVAAIHPVNERLLVHRVIAVREGHCLLKGDNMASADGLFSARDLLGKVVSVHRNGKRIRLGLGMEKLLLAWVSRLRAFKRPRSEVGNQRSG